MKKGFTLAEVLITLAVIGVVAALAIPALLTTTNQAEYKTAFKKALSVTNQALSMSVALDAVDASDSTNAETLRNIFQNKMNIIKIDGTDAFFTADGMRYEFAHTGTCSSDPITNANCSVVVDVNGDKNPNTTSSAGSYKDQYYMIIGTRSVIPGNAISQDALSN